MSLLLCFLLFFPQEDVITEDLPINPPAELHAEGDGEASLDVIELQDRFADAVDKYNSIDRSESIPMFEALIRELELREADLIPDERTVLAGSLMYLGVQNFPDSSDAFFERLIQVDPSYTLSAQRLAPKIVASFNALRDQMVGSIRIFLTDADNPINDMVKDTSVVVDGRLIGLLTEGRTFHLLAGERHIEVQKPNYETYTVDLNLPANTVTDLTGAMIRNASELVLLTHPNNVRVFFEGVEQGVTEGSPTSTLYKREIEKKGLNPSQVSGEFSIHGVQPGEYTLFLQKPCYKDKRIKINVDENKRIAYDIMELDPAAGFLSVSTAIDSAGIVYLDQNRVGALPVENQRVCPGEYTLRVQFTDGQYIKDITIKDEETLAVLAEPLPSIAWFGIRTGGNPEPPPEVAAWIKELNSWNVRNVNPNDTRLIATDPYALLFNDSRKLENTSGLTRDLGADLYMAARVVRRKVVINYLEVAFWTPLSDRIQVRSFDFRELNKLQALLKAIDTPPKLVHPWLGIQVAKLRGVQGCKIIEVHPAGPLAGKVKEGEFIRGVNGNLLNNPSDLLDIDEAAEVQIGLDDRTIRVKPLRGIAEVPFDPRAVCPQAVIAMLDKMSRYNPDPLLRSSALFNEARYQFFLDGFQPAFDILSRMNLDAAFGINQGTLHFYQALCFQKLKIPLEAENSFRRVLDHPEATLFDAYGPKAAFWADIMLQNNP